MNSSNTTNLHITVGVSRDTKDNLLYWFNTQNNIKAESIADSNFIKTEQLEKQQIYSLVERLLNNMEIWEIYSIRIER